MAISSTKRLLFVFGTRPEAIKLAPLILAFRNQRTVEVKVCVTAQHREMLDQVLDFFGIVPDHDLDLMKKDQNLFGITSNGLLALDEVLEQEQPDLVIVQGDTTTAFIGALAAYYKKIRVAHVEAGLRSHDKYAPFPEEINRKLVSQLADLHFAPTARAAEELHAEQIRDHVFTVGNTVIDALLLGLNILRQKNFPDAGIRTDRRIVLITGHRRESFGKPFEAICAAIRACAERFPETEFIYPVHLNPNVQKPVQALLSGISNVHLIEPLGYPQFISLLERSYLVLTDSGGLQEEAPSLGKPVLVMRTVTERTEGIEAGTAKLVGTDKDTIVREVSLLLSDAAVHECMAKAVNPYGDGTASEKIVSHILRALTGSSDQK